MSERIAVIGLGYVGLPVAVALGRKFDHVIGFDINVARIDELRAGQDDESLARVGILGLTFKENVPDIRNSRL